MTIGNDVRSSRRSWIGLAGLALAVGLALAPASARAGKDCGAFAVKLSDGRVFAGKKEITIPTRGLAGQAAWVKGKYVEFWVDLDTFTVVNYTLTGASARTDITNETRTVVFARRTPQHNSVLTGSLSLKLNNEQLVLRRGGPAITMKIQAKDCTQGGIFQMEPSRAVTYLHELGPGFQFGTDALNRIIYTNGEFVGRESPQRASLVGIDQSGTAARWLVKPGGRMGIVLGEDAIEP